MGLRMNLMDSDVSVRINEGVSERDRRAANHGAWGCLYRQASLGPLTPEQQPRRRSNSHDASQPPYALPVLLPLVGACARSHLPISSQREALEIAYLGRRLRANDA